jgi:hypothetical protein
MEEPGNEVSNGNILKLKHKAWMSGSGFFLDGAARRAGRAGDGVPSLQTEMGRVARQQEEESWNKREDVC